MGCSLFPGHYLIYSLNNPTRYSPRLTDGEAESREFHPLTSNYYRGEIRFQPRPSLFCNISSNLLPGTSSHNSPCTMMPLLLDLSGPYLLNAFHLCIPNTHLQWISVEAWLDWFRILSSHKAMPSLCCLTSQPEDQASYSVGVKFNETDERL